MKKIILYELRFVRETCKIFLVLLFVASALAYSSTNQLKYREIAECGNLCHVSPNLPAGAEECEQLLNSRNSAEAERVIEKENLYAFSPVWSLERIEESERLINTLVKKRNGIDRQLAACNR